MTDRKEASEGVWSEWWVGTRDGTGGPQFTGWDYLSSEDDRGDSKLLGRVQGREDRWHWYCQGVVGGVVTSVEMGKRLVEGALGPLLAAPVSRGEDAR